jgi:serine/threonine-protein kinase
VVHRDLKPSNILFNEPDTPCIADFGIARLVEEEGANRTLTGERQIGTPAYMSPELITGKIPGATIASDIYSVGVILYELLTDRQPRTGRSLVAQIAEVQTGEPPLPAKLKADVPRDLSTITARAISSDLGKRPRKLARTPPHRGAPRRRL